MYEWLTAVSHHHHHHHQHYPIPNTPTDDFLYIYSGKCSTGDAMRLGLRGAIYVTGEGGAQIGFGFDLIRLLYVSAMDPQATARHAPSPPPKQTPTLSRPPARPLARHKPTNPTTPPHPAQTPHHGRLPFRRVLALRPGLRFALARVGGLLRLGPAGAAAGGDRQGRSVGRRFLVVSGCAVKFCVLGSCPPSPALASYRLLVLVCL